MLRLSKHSFITLGLVFYFVVTSPVHAAFFDWFGSNQKESTSIQNLSPNVNAPFESKTEDEKFLEEALKFTDIMKSSALDVCQHTVILKLKTSCSSLNEEELAKLSVNLLNCQSQVDGRETFPCSEDMTLKECTIAMDANMWNAYHMMNNRARAVCMAARRAQFQALSEMTVNKLLTTAQQQIMRMTELQRGQEELEAITSDTMAVVQEGNINIMLEQDKIKNAQQSVQTSVMKNLKELSRERSLIAAGNRELDLIKQKIDETNKELLLQSLERTGHHQQVISDLDTIQKQAEAIFEKIDESTQRVLTHHQIATKQYEETLRNLKKINDTIGYLTKLFTSTHLELESRIEWIQSFLNDYGADLQMLLMIVLHITYLLVGMVLASFLNLPLLTRVALIFMLPLNLKLIYDKSDQSLDFSKLSFSLAVITIVNMVVNAVIRYVAPKSPSYYITYGDGKNAYSSKPNIKPTFIRRLIGYFQALKLKVGVSSRNDDAASGDVNDSIVSSTGRHPLDNNSTLSPQRTPRQNVNRSEELVSRWLDQDRYSTGHRTPSISSASARMLCAAQCRTGRPCRKMAAQGSDYCHTHVFGCSING